MIERGSATELCPDSFTDTIALKQLSMKVKTASASARRALTTNFEAGMKVEG